MKDLPERFVIIIFLVILLVTVITVASLMKTNIGTNLAKTLGILTALG
jgi:hypothetical protein